MRRGEARRARASSTVTSIAAFARSIAPSSAGRGELGEPRRPARARGRDHDRRRLGVGHADVGEDRVAVGRRPAATAGRYRSARASRARSGGGRSGRTDTPRHHRSARTSSHSSPGGRSTATSSPGAARRCPCTVTSGRLTATVRVRALGVDAQMIDKGSRGSRRASGPTSATSSAPATPPGSRRSRSTGPRCATPSGPPTTRELIRAFDLARDDPAVGVVILTGAGDRRLLQRRRPEDPRRRRLRRRAGDRPAQRPRPPDPDPPPPEARRRDGGRLRDRRRPRPPPVLRPHDRGRERAVRSDGPARRLVRRRLRDRPARPADRREAREGDLAALPAVRRRDRARRGGS